MAVWMLLCSVLVNGITAGLFFLEVKKQKEDLYPKGKKEIVELAAYCVPAIMLTLGLSVFIAVFYRENTFLFTLKRVVMLALLWPIAYIDLKTNRIPNRFIAAGLILRAVLLAAEFFWARDTVIPALLTEFAASLLLFVAALLCTLIIKNSIGGGDMKLFLVMGLLLGLQGTWGAVFLSLIVSFIAAVVLLITRKKSRKDSIPFGPAVAIGTYLSIFLTGM